VEEKTGGGKASEVDSCRAACGPKIVEKNMLGFGRLCAYIRVWLAHLRSPPFFSVSDCPGGINLLHLRSNGRPPKDQNEKRRP